MRAGFDRSDGYLVAAVQMVSGDSVADNLQHAERLIAQAARDGARLVGLPEYFCLLSADETAKVRIAETLGEGPIQAFLRESAARHGIWLSGGTLPIRSDVAGKVYNASFLYSPDGSQIARYDKVHLFSYTGENERFDEGRTILAGKAPVRVDCPLGSLGLSVCYDLRFPEFYRALMPLDLILVPSAFTYTTGQAHWTTLLKARAIENQCYVLAPAQGGMHPHGRKTWGHSVLIDPWGEIIAQLEQGPGVVMGQLSHARIREVRQALPALHNRIIGNE